MGYVYVEGSTREKEDIAKAGTPILQTGQVFFTRLQAIPVRYAQTCFTPCTSDFLLTQISAAMQARWNRTPGPSPTYIHVTSICTDSCSYLSTMI